MNILVYRHSLLSRGGDKMIVLQANHLASQGHSVSILTAVMDTVFTLDQRINVSILPSRSKFATILTAVTTSFSADLIIADIIAMVTFLAIRNRDKVICYAQDYDESYYSSTAPKLLIRLFYLFSLTFFRIPAIAVSHPLGSLLSRRYHADVRVVENGIDTSRFFPDPDSELLTLKAGRKAILVLARSDLRKGFDIACEVIRRLEVTSAAQIEVWTVGEENASLFAGIAHRHHGYVDENRLRCIMSSADIFLYPSRHEGYPLMVLESFACNCPVVTTVAVPYAEQLVNALVSNIEDTDTLTAHVRLLLDDPDLADELASRAYRFALEHDLASTCQQFADSLESLHGR